MNIQQILQFKYPNANTSPVSTPDYTLVDYSDGQGVSISLWNEDMLGAKPTIDNLQNIEASQEYQDYLITLTPEYKQAQEVANHPITQYLLQQIQASNPSFVIPQQDEIITTVTEQQTTLKSLPIQRA